MAKTRKLTATAPDGSLFTRTTARTYTHVVAYTYDAAKREAFDTLKDWVINEAKNWAYDAKIAQHGDGTGSAYGAPVEGEAEWRAKDRAAVVARSVAFIAKHPTVEAYHAACLASRRAYSARMVADGWCLAGWCGRLDLAQKLAAKDHFCADKVVIIPVNA
jgi:hypothetical protein